MPRPNDRCPCGSGLKFKRCCRNKDRDPETCFFCKKVEVRETRGRFVSVEGSEVWVCESCFEERRDKSGGLDVAMMLAMIAGFKGWGGR